MTFISSNLKKLNESEQLFLWCLGLSLTSVGGSGSMSRHVTNYFSIYTCMYFFIKIGPVGLRMEPLKFTKISFILIKSIDAIESFAIRNRTSLLTCNKPIQEVSFFWISRVLSDSQTNNIWLYLITYRNKRKLRREMPPLSSTSVRLITCTKTNSNPTITEWTNNKIYQNWLEKTAVHSYTRGGTRWWTKTIYE